MAHPVDTKGHVHGKECLKCETKFDCELNFSN